MAADTKIAAAREISVLTFKRVKDLVRQLEDDERRIAPDIGAGQIEFRLSADDMAWYVAYKTSAAALNVSAVNPAED